MKDVTAALAISYGDLVVPAVLRDYGYETQSSALRASLPNFPAAVTTLARSLLLDAQHSGKELTVLFLVEPSVFDVEELSPGHMTRKRESVDGKLAIGLFPRASGL
jgi:hypothetical protein